MVTCETLYRTVVTGNGLRPGRHCATSSRIVVDDQIPGKPSDGRALAVENGNREGTTRGVSALIGGEVTDDCIPLWKYGAAGMVTRHTQYRTIVAGCRLGPCRHCITRSRRIFKNQVSGQSRNHRALGIENRHCEETGRRIPGTISGRIVHICRSNRETRPGALIGFQCGRTTVFRDQGGDPTDHCTTGSFRILNRHIRRHSRDDRCLIIGHSDRE